MSKHHHGVDGSGGHLRHNWFFYVSGFFLLLALLAFTFYGMFAGHVAPSPVTPPPATTSGR